MPNQPKNPKIKDLSKIERPAEKEKIKVIVAGGKDLDNLKQILRGKKFKGTIIG